MDDPYRDHMKLRIANWDISCVFCLFTSVFVNGNQNLVLNTD